MSDLHSALHDGGGLHEDLHGWGALHAGLHDGGGLHEDLHDWGALHAGLHDGVVCTRVCTRIDVTVGCGCTRAACTRSSPGSRGALHEDLHED